MVKKETQRRRDIYGEEGSCGVPLQGDNDRGKGKSVGESQRSVRAALNGCHGRETLGVFHERRAREAAKVACKRGRHWVAMQGVYVHHHHARVDMACGGQISWAQTHIFWRPMACAGQTPPAMDVMDISGIPVSTRALSGR